MYVRVRVTPAAKKELIKKHSETEFEISVKEPAKQNMANKRVRELLAEAMGKAIQDVRLTAGHHSRTKVFDIINTT